MSAVGVVSRWTPAGLEPRDDCDVHPAVLRAADSWLTDDGATLALGLHRERFRDAALEAGIEPAEVDAFWEAAIAQIPRSGAWFPRVEARESRGRVELLARVRPAPERRRSVTLATYHGRDPRTRPRIKGPDLEAMLRLRTEAQARGAQEAVLLGPGDAIVEGSTSCLLWWRGDAIAVPADDLERIDSVTVRSVLALAAATGVEVVRERATPADLEGCEVWALNALHGIRIVTAWIDGPDTAEEPGRLGAWRSRLDALRRPLPEGASA